MRVGAVRRGKAELCRAILADLKPWFGIPEEVDHYVEVAARLPMLACRVDDEVGGFVSLMRHGPATWEIYVLGVRRALHRRGIGRALLKAAEAHARAQGGRFLTVKTLPPAVRSRAYARTRAFYYGIGFATLETLPDLWGPGTSCLFMAKNLHPSRR